MDFYTLKSLNKGTDNYICEIALNPIHPVYEGHFPELPVTPGVCMLQIIKECVSLSVNTPLRYAHVNSCKFLAVVNPKENAELELTFTINETYGIQAVLSVVGNPVMKLKATLTPEI